MSAVATAKSSRGDVRLSTIILCGRQLQVSLALFLTDDLQPALRDQFTNSTTFRLHALRLTKQVGLKAGRQANRPIAASGLPHLVLAFCNRDQSLSLTFSRAPSRGIRQIEAIDQRSTSKLTTRPEIPRPWVRPALMSVVATARQSPCRIPGWRILPEAPFGCTGRRTEDFHHH